MRLLKKNISNTQNENNWKYLALHDEMTSLYNKRGFEEALKDTEKINTVIYVDINNLKRTNDKFGHEIGNKLIKRCAQALMEHFKDESYRIGGDEFIVLTTISYEECKKIVDEIKGLLEYLTENNEDHLIYSASFGIYPVNEDKLINKALKEAEKLMYEEKSVFKNKGKQPNEKAPQKEYNELLSKEQQYLKQQIKENHEEVIEESTFKILQILKEKNDLIEAILIANNTFDYLFIFLQPENFYSLVQKMEMSIDFSYLYVLYQKGPQYYGNDEYTSEITHLFEDIGDAILKRKLHTLSDLTKIKGINIFKEIYTDFLEEDDDR